MKDLLTYYVKIWKGKLKPGGFKNYETTIDYIERFMQKYFTSGDIFLSQLDMQSATDFEHYIRNYPIKAHDPCLGNGVAKHVQRFKRLLNWAVEIQWIKVNPCEKYSRPQKRTKRKKLTIEELVAMEEKQFLDPSINYVKELFLYSCYTGLAFVDAMALKASDFEWDAQGALWCRIYRTKSDGLCPVPLLKSAANILHKYLLQAGGDSNRCIFPIVTNQHANKCLKIIKETCGIITPMTYHVARHTFAKTVALKNGVPLETVQMMLGHTKISTTQIYADVDEEKIMGDMNGIEDKLDKKRKNVLSSVNTQMIGINANDGRFSSKSA
jgi:site-specific recombinase XerD